MATNPNKYISVNSETGCWNWTGSLCNGYGTAYLGKRKPIRAHRYVYQLHKGEIPAGLDLDHLCRNRACVNPDHLEPVTRKENLRRGAGTKIKGELLASIKSAYLSGKSIADVATDFGVSKSGISPFLKGLRKYTATPCPTCGAFLSKNHACGTKRPIEKKPYQLRDHCKNGHEMNARNTYWRQGRAFCRACNLTATWKRRGKVVPAKPTDAEFNALLGL